MDNEVEILTNFELRNMAPRALFESIYESVVESAIKGLTLFDFDVNPKFESGVIEMINKYLPEVILEKRGIGQDRHNYNNIKYRMIWRE